MVKVVYLGNSSSRTNPTPKVQGDAIELLANNWDDYGYKTSFATTTRIDGERIDLGFIRILVEGQKTTSSYLDALLRNGWDGVFPIPNENYISTPAEIAFYEQLAELISPPAVRDVAEKLRDASYLTRVAEDNAARAIIESDGFAVSLQRERGSVKAYIDAWKIFTSQDLSVLDLGFRFEDVFGKISTLRLAYQTQGRLPHDINVLIGPNGSGKSRVLHQIARHWIGDNKDKDIGFIDKPNLSQVVVVSYSPFEQFPVDLQRHRAQDKNIYRYFGFRGRSKTSSAKRVGGVRLSHDFPKRNAAEALLECAVSDQRYNNIRGWAQKIKTAESVLSSAFEYDFAAVEVTSSKNVSRFFRVNNQPSLASVTVEGVDEDRRYIPITSSSVAEINIDLVAKHLEAGSGVCFFKGGELLKLSSGQRLFAYVVIDILGAIRRNSLILIDEPELFLHPTLEIQFIDMLKRILEAFNSKALIATHSVVTVREVPASCVHVFERTSEGLVIKKPPFQTFGGDFQRISSYVFGDRSVSKPYEAWLKKQLAEFGSSDAVIEAIGSDLNEELIVQLKAMDEH